MTKSSLSTNNLDKDAIAKPTAATVSSKQSRLISKVLSPALRLWLRSLVEQVSDLEVKISGSDRQILMGNIPNVSIRANQAVYQGLHLEQIHLVGNGIRTNLSQVLRGQPLRLVEPVLVYGELLVQQAGLNASLQSSLLSTALTDLLQMLLPKDYSLDGQVKWHKITIDTEQLILSGTLTHSSSTMPLSLRCGLQLLSCHELQLTYPQLQIYPDVLLEKLENFNIDLGLHVDLQELTLHPGELVCRGGITVMPA